MSDGTTSSSHSKTVVVTVPSDQVDLHHKHELARLASRYSIGSPLSRVRTRTDSSCLWHLPSPDAATAMSPRPPPGRVLYEDEFVKLSSSTLVVADLLFRREVAIPLARVHKARPFCSPAQLVQLAAASRPGPGHAMGGAGTTPGRPPRGVVVRGLGATGVIWARDPARVKDERWKERAVVINAEGWLGRIGFTVDDAEAWWAAWEEATG